MTGTRYRTLKDQLEAEIANAERRAYNPWQQTELYVRSATSAVFG